MVIQGERVLHLRFKVRRRPKGKDATMPELLIDFITSLDGYAAADAWPGWLGGETGTGQVSSSGGRRSDHARR